MDIVVINKKVGFCYRVYYMYIIYMVEWAMILFALEGYICSVEGKD